MSKFSEKLKHLIKTDRGKSTEEVNTFSIETSSVCKGRRRDIRGWYVRPKCWIRGAYWVTSEWLAHERCLQLPQLQSRPPLLKGASRCSVPPTSRCGQLPSPAARRTRERGGTPGHFWPLGLVSGATKLSVHKGGNNHWSFQLCVLIRVSY